MRCGLRATGLFVRQEFFYHEQILNLRVSDMRLIFLRHAKSSWEDADAADFERPLAARGRRDASAIAADMVKRKLRPTLLVVSAAQRTRETLGHLLQFFNHDMVVRVDAALYGGDAESYISKVNDAAGVHSEILVLGHNPSIQDASLLLTGTAKELDLSRMRSKFPTAAYAVLDFAAAAAETGAAHLECFIAPSGLVS